MPKLEPEIETGAVYLFIIHLAIKIYLKPYTSIFLSIKWEYYVNLIRLLWAKEVRLYNGEKTAFSTSGAGKTRQLHVKE